MAIGNSPGYIPLSGFCQLCCNWPILSIPGYALFPSTLQEALNSPLTLALVTLGFFLQSLSYPCNLYRIKVIK